LVQKKIAFAAAHAFAMEAATTQCAAFIDRGSEDYMLETAILKVFATEHLWTIVNDTLQVWGGKGYFSDQPIERWMRDARINTIGEGANDVLKAFIAVVGCKGPGEYLKGLRDEALGGVMGFFKRLPAALGVGTKLVAPWLTTGTPSVPVKSFELRYDAHTLGRMTRDFGLKLPHVFMRLKDEATFAQAQLVHERIADIAIDLYVSACVLSRLDYLLGKAQSNGQPADPFADVSAGRYFLDLAFRRISERFAALESNDDPSALAAAKAMIAKF
jgi:acyl-CoA dehydrogenase family protein 9